MHSTLNHLIQLQELTLIRDEQKVARGGAHLEQLDDALQRVEDGVYGICVVTGKLIPKERLEVVLVAKQSVEGKELLKKRAR